ncbi:ABC transporter substrate-binding protein [Acetobacter cibinongensis]|uniref:ABC transporter substrate-binding protein n=1 Tax=Acetobacter cibinongensis TaxID=146475 RepID=A0ABQ0V6R5_9PROT|nr:zinc ABC transporter substrate-binding protein [Acetobacter cibinongensis]GEL59560.1 ABC transporter substrate-binding protein [Acetobacter cibinongensis]
MRCPVSLLSCLMVCGLSVGAVTAQARPLLVAAENTWGDLAEQIAEPDMEVRSILTQPALDPHLYEPGPAEGRLVHDAALIVANGAGYDPWIDRLAAARSGQPARLVRAQDVMTWHEGDNTHLWYNFKVVRAFVERLVTECQQADPIHSAAYATRGVAVLSAVGQVEQQAAQARTLIGGMVVAATEPVFTPLAERLGLIMKEQAFQLAIMNDVEPPASAVAAFHDDIEQQRIRMVAYNAQADRPSVQRLIALARQKAIPVLPVQEIMPQGLHWQSWVGQTIEHVIQALGKKQ